MTWTPLLNFVIAIAVVIAGGWSCATITAWFRRHSELLPLANSRSIGVGLGSLTLGTSIVVALDQIGLAGLLMRQLVLVVVGAAFAAAALAVGLGTREVVGGLVAGHLVRRRIRAGDHVEVAGFQGTVREVGPVATVIEADDEDGLTHRHSVPNRCMLNEAIQ